MPQMGSRRKAFSNKQKRKQLQDKRERKREKEESGCWGGRGGRHRHRGHGHGHGHCHDHGRHHSHDRGRQWGHSSNDHTSDSEADEEPVDVRRINHQPAGPMSKGYDPNRFRLHFQAESKAELQRRKESARQTLTMLPETALEIDIDELYRPGTALDMPKRPPWDYNMSRQQVQDREEAYFKKYLQTLFEKYESQELSYLELNLETWQQLWRVLEMADIVLLITDIRHPALHFSPALHNYVTKEMKKPLILVLNKVDLAPPALVVAWRSFFRERFPDVHVVCFTSFPKTEHVHDDPGKVVHRKQRRRAYTPMGPKQLLEACEEIVQGKVDLSSWRRKIEGEMSTEREGAQDQETDDDEGEAARVTLEERDGSFHEHQQYHDGVLTIGCCGYPNVGKSSLMNGLMGHKVVSVSKTPGHTKHFQTIYLTPKVKLCDSPGLVFPSLVPKSLQILAGIYPIAQVREPFTAVGFLAERINLPRLLHLQHPDNEGTDSQAAKDLQWSAFDICDAWAHKRGFLTAKAARLDSYRAANHLLRLALDGRLCLCMRPPGFTAKRAYWEAQPETEEIARLQEAHRPLDPTRWGSDMYSEALHIPDSEEEYERMVAGRHDADRDKNEAEVGTGSSENRSEEEEEEGAGSGGVATSNPFSLLAKD